MSWRIVIRAHGGPEVLEREAITLAAPGPGEVAIAQEAIGLNFIDVYHRIGLYPGPLPGGLGREAVGRIAALGNGVEGLRVGQRVGYVGGGGAYATDVVIAADLVLPIPDDVLSDVAAAVMLKGMTAVFLAESCARVRPGQWALVHAAAGGVGSLLVPLLSHLGVHVIAHAGSADKAAKARALGAEPALSGPFDDLAARVRDLTGGAGVDVVFDGVGKESWAASLASLRRRGLMVSYGNASGAVPPMSVLELSKAGSLFLTRPTLFDYIATREELRATGARLFGLVEQGVLRAEIGQRFPLAAAAEAQRALEARETTGSTVLVP
jgi:NADPH2:quinone reductase